MKNKGEINMDETKVETIDRNAEIAELFAHKTELIERNKMIDGELDLAKSELKEREQRIDKGENR